MTNWMPHLEDGPRYLAIADALATDIAAGKLAIGERLPTHRDLAWRLGVTVGTITRAYAEAERRGLVVGEVGRGTFVREQLPSAPPVAQDRRGADGMIDLSYNFPTLAGDGALLAETLGGVAADPQLPDLLGYHIGPGREAHRQAGAAWLQRSGLPTEADQVVITCGAQHGMMLAAAALARPGDVVLTESLTYYGIKALAEMLELQLYGVPIDAQGIVPDALEAAIRTTGAKVLYAIPTLQNPTTSIMPETRRQEIAEICQRLGVTLVEDDIYGFLPEDGPPPLSRHLPDLSVYVTSLSKCVAPGLRTGYLRAPRHLMEGMAKALRASTLVTSGFMAEAAARLIASGKADHAVASKRSEAEARQRLAAEVLGPSRLMTNPQSFHAWLPLPRPWRHEDFTAEALRRGVLVGSARVFAVGRQPVPHAVRLCLHAAGARADLRKGLEILNAMLEGGPEGDLPLV